MAIKTTIAMLALLLSSCGGSDVEVGERAGAEYFPVAVGATWTYEATTWTEPGSWSTTFTVPGMADVGGKHVWVFKESNRTKHGGAYETYFAKEDGAVTFLGNSPTFDFMMEAAPWELLRSDGAFGSAPLLELKQIHAVTDQWGTEETIDLKIVGTRGEDETITTLAGTFTARRFDYSFIATRPGPSGSYQDQHLLTEWRARGVGLLRQKYSTGVQFGSTNWDKQLVSYSIPSARP